MPSAPVQNTSVLTRAWRALAKFPWWSGDTVRSPEHIAALLTRLSLEAPMITVTFGKNGVACASSVLEVSKKADRIWLDELSSTELTSSPQIRASLIVSGYLDGASVRFTAPIAEFGRRNGVVCYGLSRPRRIKYSQRRTHQRFHCLENMPVYLVDAGAKVQHAILNDISLGGLRPGCCPGVD